MDNPKISNSLKWDVDVVPIMLNGKQTPYFNLVRKDNGKMLGSCTIKYKIKQNREFVSDALSAAKRNGFSIKDYKTGVVDEAGKMVYVKLNTGVYRVGEDFLKESVTVVHHHDGRAVGNRSFCTYLFENGMSFNFNLKASNDIDEVLCAKCTEEIILRMRKMKKKPVNPGDLNAVVDFLTDPKSKSSKMEHIRERLATAISDSQNSWEVFKGIVKYASESKSSKDRKTSMFVGSSNKMIEAAFSLLSDEK